MTTILGVDISSSLPQQENSRQPTEDFTRELAKHDGQTRLNTRDDTKAMENRGFDEHAPVSAEEGGSNPQGNAQLIHAEAQSIETQDIQLAARAEMTPPNATQALLKARIFGWHAMAQVYLSELSLANQDFGKHAVSLDEKKAIDSTVEIASEKQFFAKPGLAVAEEDVLDVPVTKTSTQASSYAEAGEADRSATSEVVVADLQASAYWAERSLRFIRERNGSCVAWLRDFRLSERETSDLIQVLLNDAKRNGIKLSKIMLNGREAWSLSTNI